MPFLTRENFLKAGPIWNHWFQSQNELLNINKDTLVDWCDFVPVEYKSNKEIRETIASLIHVVPDYEEMDIQQSEDWIYHATLNKNELFDSLPLECEKMLLYRLEDQQGVGVFENGIGLKYLNAPETGCPEKDPMFCHIFGTNTNQKYRKKWFFACQNFEQLKQWINTKHLPLLEQYGIVVSVYEVSKQWVIDGSVQSIFMKSHSVKIDEFSLSVIFKQKNTVSNKI